VTFHRFPYYCLIGICFIFFSGCGAPRHKPNVVIILVDDLGWTDLGSYGSTFYETPNIDQLAGEGMKFTQFYTAGTNCSPTRASIMTGVSPARLKITNWIGGTQVGETFAGRQLRTPAF
jgi:arylsulfatase A-like enzyme